MSAGSSNWGVPAPLRYEAKVDRSAGPDACHPWTGGTHARGRYGKFYPETVETESGKWRSRGVSAHRYGYELLVGPIPGGEEVRHTCDYPLCQNQAHWVLGTHKQNMADMVERGRHRFAAGEAHPSSKLTKADVVSIRERYAAGEANQVELAREHGISQALVSAIVRRRTWKHV